jgi:hypothetical protein
VYRTTLSISLLAIPLWAGAQTAGDYFHKGAQYYIWGEKQKATNEIYTGLRVYPDDSQLQGLAGLIKKEEEQKQQQQQQQNNQKQDEKKDQDQKSQSQQDKSGEKQDSSQQQQQQAQQQKEEDQKQQQAAEQDQKQKDKDQQSQQQQQAQAAAGESKDKSGETNDNENASYAVGQMTPQQARQLLDAQKNEDMVLPAKPPEKPLSRSGPLRDW